MLAILLSLRTLNGLVFSLMGRHAGKLESADAHSGSSTVVRFTAAQANANSLDGPLQWLARRHLMTHLGMLNRLVVHILHHLGRGARV